MKTLLSVCLCLLLGACEIPEGADVPSAPAAAAEPASSAIVPAADAEAAPAVEVAPEVAPAPVDAGGEAAPVAETCHSYGNCEVNLCAPATFTVRACPADQTLAICWYDEGTPTGSHLQQSGCNPEPGVTCVSACGS